MSEASKTPKRKRSARLDIGVGSLLFLLITGMVNYLAFRHFERWDWTRDAHFTLSGRSKQVLHRLDRDVSVYVFLADAESEFDDVRELLRRYEAESTHVKVHAVDPDRERGEYQLLARRFGLGTAQTEEGTRSNVAAVVAVGDRHYKIDRGDLVSLDYGSFDEQQGPKVDVKAERALTGAIVELTTGRATKVCTATGHGEWELEGTGARSLATLRDELELDNVELEAIEIRGGQALPRTCDALFVIGPQRPFAEDEANALAAYVRGGGRLLVCADPMFREGAGLLPTGLEGMMREFGITLGNDLVLELDPNHLLGGGPTELFAASDFGDHAITAELRVTQGFVAFHSARSVGVVENGPAALLVRTTPSGYAETDVASLQNAAEPQAGPGDVRGPVGLAAVYPASAPQEGSANQGRLVVVGDSDWLRNELVTQAQFGNVDFASAITGFLTARPALISIAPRRTNAQALVMTAADVWSIFGRVVVLLPLAFVLLGFSVWWSRRA